LFIKTTYACIFFELPLSMRRIFRECNKQMNGALRDGTIVIKP